MLSRDQWKRVLDEVVKEGLFTSVDILQLLPYLRQGGLSNHQVKLLQSETSGEAKNRMFESFLRTRPRLADSLRSGLEACHSPLLEVVDRTIAQVVDSEIELDAERFRSALQREETEMAELSEWAIDGLVEGGCLTTSEQEDVAMGSRRLFDTLMDKSPKEWRCLMNFLEWNHEDMFHNLRRAYDPSDPMETEKVPHRGRVPLRFIESEIFQENEVTSSVKVKGQKNVRGATSEQTIWPLRERVDIQITLSEYRTILHSVRPDDTLESVVDMLRRAGTLMGVLDIRVGASRSLMDDSDWRHRTMQEIGLRPGSTLSITSTPPTSVMVLLFSPAVWRCVDSHIVTPLKSEVTDLNFIEDTVRLLSQIQIGFAAVTFQGRLQYLRKGQPHRAIWSYNDKTMKYLYVDEDDGAEDTEEDRTHVLLEFLTVGSGVRAPVSYLPVLEMHPTSEVFSIDSEGSLQPTFKTALLFPSSLLLLRGLRLRDPNGATLTLLLQLYGTEYLNIASGDVYANQDDATAATPTMNGVWYRVFILISKSSLLPQYVIPKGKTVQVFTRAGWDVSIHERRVTGQATAFVETGSVWKSSWIPCQFSQDLSEQMNTSAKYAKAVI